MKAVRSWIASLLFSFGLIIAGSDGDWWPWFNLVGIVMFGAVGIVANETIQDRLSIIKKRRNYAGCRTQRNREDAGTV